MQKTASKKDSLILRSKLKSKLFLISVLLIPVSASAQDNFIGDLGEVVVRGEKKNVINGSISNQITFTEVEDQGSENLNQALDYLPGVDSRREGKGEGHIKVRGFSQDNLKVLIDGVPAYEGYLGTVDLTALSVESIDRIAVSKGAGSVLYGPNTMGGVVNIITRKGISGKGRAKIRIGDSGTACALNTAGISGNLNYYIGGDIAVSDGYSLSEKFDANNSVTGRDTDYRENGGIREGSDFEKKSAVINLGFNPDELTRANLSFVYAESERGIPVERSRFWSFSEWRQWHLNLALERKLGVAAVLKTSVFYVDHNDEITDDSDLTIANGGISWFDKSRYDDFSAGGTINSSVESPAGVLNAGISYQKDSSVQVEYNKKNKAGLVILSGWSDEADYEADTYSVGMEDILTQGRIKFIPAFSYDMFFPLKTGGAPKPSEIYSFNPRIGIEYSLTKKVAGYFSLGRKTRFPRLKELFSTHVGGNPDLEEQNTVATEAGVSVRGENYEMYCSLFHNRIKNLIESSFSDTGDRIYINAGENLIYGAESEARKSFTDYLSGVINYTYLIARDFSDDTDMELRPRHKVNLKIKVSPVKKVDLFCCGSYSSSQKQYLFESGQIVERTITPNAQLDLRAVYAVRKVSIGDIKLFVDVKNVTDENLEEGNGPLPGRSLSGGLILDF